MKVRNGKVRLDSCERRFGNFVIRDEKDHVKLFDIGQTFTHRVAKRTPVGMFLEQSFEGMDADGRIGRGLGNYAAVLWSAFSAVPDTEFLEAVYKAAEDCMRRHPEAYGVTETDVTDERDAEIVTEEKELKEFEDEVRRMEEDV